ncbi:MAG: electron transfer flavoprotein subunit alpha/FixB family protein [Desulfovibrio sp.]|jgi:electron transfer flavoprotein alpha subunit|nr:electron transfer flavoprotein subunit alpha/FixB family protein [Desulfovibrio sp.]
MNSWIIITDERRTGGMLAAVRQLGGSATAAVVGARSLAETVAKAGFDKVLLFAAPENLPPEAYAAQVADAVAAAAPRLVVSSDMPSARVLLGAAAVKLNAAVAASVKAIAARGDSILVTRSIAEGKLVEILEVKGPAACIFDGEDVDQVADRPTAIEEVPVRDPGGALRVVETTSVDADSAGLLTAAKVVGLGLGILTRDDLELIRDLAAAVHAEIACTLPVCDDMRWFDSSRVVGSSHSQIAPDLYIAVGISGQPQHMSGVRDAKTIVAINNDPEARIFKNCDYGILGDLYKLVPVLTAAFKAAG